MNAQRHVVHILYRFAAGGLENVLVQLINGLPREQFRHTVVALTEADSDFTARIERNDVEIICLRKPPGQPFALYPVMYRLLKRLRPDIVHTCNIAALEFMPVAWLARIPHRVHAEHGWDVADPAGSNERYRLLRRLYKPFVHTWIAVSIQLHDYLLNVIRVPAERLHLLENGVDTERFHPRQSGDVLPDGFPFNPNEHFIVGTVGRLEPIKNQQLLVNAFIELLNDPANRHMRLVVIGEGPLREQLQSSLKVAGLAALSWVPGSRADIPAILRTFDCFVLPSLAEGTSCTLQEAMATQCPIIATNVGGNADLLSHGQYGALIESDNVQQLCCAIHLQASKATSEQDLQGIRAQIMKRYSLKTVLQRYQSLLGA